MQRLGFALLAVLSLSACSSTGVSDRYAFWRDNNSNASDGVKPNLADVPVPPNTQETQAQMDTMRQRLETDRDNAYLAAQGYPVADVTPVSDATVAQYADTVASNELAPISDMPAYQPSAAVPAYSQQQPVQATGTVQYNYAPDGQTYVYGNSNAQYGDAQRQMAQQQQQSAYQHEAYQVMAQNPNVSINFDALEGAASGGASSISPVGVSGQPLVFFKHGSARLGTGDKRKLKELADHIKKQPQSVVVVGYASKRTGIKNQLVSREANLTMSAKRASAVMHELARHGVKPQQLNVTAQGDTGAGGKMTETQDRRVDILFD